MTRDEAIAYGKEQLEIFGGLHQEFIRMAIEALERVDSLERENEFLKSMQRVLTQDIPVETLGRIVNAVRR